MLREFPELEPKPDDPKLKLQKMITGMSVKQEGPTERHRSKQER